MNRALIVATFVFAQIICSQARAQNNLEQLLDGIASHPRRIVSIPLSGTKLSVQKIVSDPDGAMPGLVLCWIEIPAQYSNFSVLNIQKFGPSYQLFEEASGNSVALINGGFFGYDAKGGRIPLGLSMGAGSRFSPLVKWTTGGVFVQTDTGALDIVPIRSFSNQKGVRAAVQSKPLLVENRSNGIRADDGSRFNRTAIGMTANKSVVLIGAFESFGRAVTLKEFTSFITRLPSLKRTTVVTALALDGGPGSQIYFPSVKLHFGDPGNNYVPNAIAIGK